jgi:hypothetical protein
MRDNWNRLGKWIREISAIGLWVYAGLKLFVADIDVYVIQSIAPKAQWLLNWRPLILAGVLALLWLVAGHKGFFGWFAYVVGYPFVVLCYHLPRRLWSKWPLLVVFAPAIYTFVRSARLTLLLYVAAVTAASVIAFQTAPTYLVPAMVVLALFLVVRLYRACRESQASSVFASLTSLARDLRDQIEGGSFDQTSSASPAAPKVAATRAELDEYKTLPPLYLFHCAADYISRKVDETAKSRKYNRLLMLAWLHVVAVALITYSLEYWALFRMAPESFRDTVGAGFLQFLIYTLTVLVNSSVSPIKAVSQPALLIASSELLCAILIFFTGVFSILSAWRDQYREGLDAFTKALGEAASAIEARIVAVYQLSAEGLECLLVTHNAEFINFLRKTRGRPELVPSIGTAGAIEVTATATTVTKLADGAGHDEADQ